MFLKKTKRLVLRPLELSDFEVWRDGYLKNEDSKNLWDFSKRDASRLTKSSFRELLKRQKQFRKSDEYYDFAIFKKKSDEMIGYVSAMNMMRSITQSAFLGYSIHNSHWGQGYGREAVTGFLDIAFKQLKLHRLEAGVEPHNKRSIYLIRSVGFRKEGLKKRAVFLRDRWQDLTIYSATCEDFGYKWSGNFDMNKRF